MATASTKLEEAEYRKWASNLVGKDWEIFWQEDEDGNEDEAMDDEVPNAAAPATTTTITASGQETCEEKKGTLVDIEMKDGNKQSEGSFVKSNNMVKTDDKNNTDNKLPAEPVESSNGNDDDDGSEGSVIDDWYDGRVLGIIDDESGSVGENGWKFKVAFVGDEEIYQVFLEPGKVRPSARGWLQRTIALLNPPATAAGENENNNQQESNLPPDTSTLEDQKHLKVLASKIIDSSNLVDYNPTVSLLPSYSSFRRIQLLRFQLESQMYLREKLSKIENHAGKELFTDGVRNPTENYVNYLTQCCKDLAQACSWYCDSWKLLFYYFGNSTTSNGGAHGMGRENINSNEKTAGEEHGQQSTDLGTLTFEGLIKEYLEYGKNTIVNATMIDVNATGPSNKRRQAIAPDSNSNNRRTKRRRKTSSTTAGSDEETNENNAKLLAAASKLDTEILSKCHVDNLVETIVENVHYPHIAILGKMLKSLSHLVVEPLVSWKNQARRILGIANKGNDAYHLMIDNINKDGVKMTDSDSENEEAEVFFSDEQIEACLSAVRSNNVLSRFNLFDEIHKLHAKLGDIQKNEAKALVLMQDLASTTPILGQKTYDRTQDRVLSGLKAILNEMDSPESTLYNIDPLSTKSSLSVITRGDLSKAMELRAWFVDVQHALSVRERKSFLESLISKIEPTNTLPDPNDIPVLANVPQVVQQRESLIRRVLELQSKITNCASSIEKRENDFFAASSSVDISNSSDLTTHLAFLQSTLSELKELPVMFLLEEKIAARIDLVQWYKKANDVLGSASDESKNLLPFLNLKLLYEELQTVLRGFSTTRTATLDGVASDGRTDDEISKFLASDHFFNCENIISKVTTTYSSSSYWQKRAESIILCLRAYGNPNAGEAMTSQKLPAMVDIKRIVDLTTEYPGLQVDIPGFFEKLQRIQSDAYEWSQNLYSTMMDDNRSFEDALSFIQKERDHRPKGIIIYPTRTVADSTVDFLAWYEKTKHEAKLIAGELQQRSGEGFSRESPAVYSSLIVERLYPILADGSEALEIYCNKYISSNEILSQLKLNSDKCVEILERRFRIRKTAKAPSREKINANNLISSLFSRMGSRDQSDGFPLQLMLWVYWHLLVADFVTKPENEEKGLGRDQVRSLQQAKQLKEQNPFPSDLDLSNATDTQILAQSKSTELIEFERTIEEARNAEAAIKKSLSTSKELLRGALLEKAERIREHLNNLRTMISMLKARSKGDGGLSINGAFENPLERHIKYFTWLVRTLQYPVLHQGEASFSSSSEANDTESPRIPFNALVSIHERMPSEISEFGDHILCILRVRELYTAATRWQDEVSRSTLISNRGNKRRGKASDNDSKDAEKDAKICMRKMEMLAEDQILSKVDMPRHKAVKAMVDAKKEFEIQLESFLAQDFEGNQDNAPLPKGDSLVGPNGQFILYRLTGSSLFSMMQDSVQSLGAIGDNVFAETRGKAAFDWMRSAVTWIEELEDAVTKQSKFTNVNEKLLVVPLKDAKKLCKTGETIFLETTNKDVTRTLSNHGIYVSVNSIKKRLNVRLKKDGAHHSVGGIIIRWCPILFDALRADVAKLESWEIGLNKVIGDFNKFLARSSDTITGENHLYQWFCYHTKVQAALEEGQNALVVSPAKDVIDSFMDVLRTIRKHLDKNCSRDMIQEFSKRLFSNSASLYNGRFDLLDSLLYWREIGGDFGNEAEKNQIAVHETKPSPRDICRSNLEKALSRAAWVLNLESTGLSGVEDLCALKAWEIELEMFETFQDENGNIVLDAYRAKGRSLKNIFENASNIPICLEILTDDIAANTLIKTTAEQFANRLKLEREKAKEASLKDDSLTEGSNTGKPLKSILRNKKSALLTLKNAPTSPKGEDESKKTSIDAYAAFDSDMLADSDEEESMKSKPKPSPAASVLAANKKRRTRSYERPRSPPPPPPPSLVGSFDTSIDDLSSAEPRISNASGGDSFRMELQGQVKYTFSAMFYQEDTSQASVKQLMPESMIQMGRSKINDFRKFLSEKLRGSRWQATVLRLATDGDRDASVYKSFYKDFESKERIAMFKLCDDSGKLFLVTPKFHHVAKRRGIAFGHNNSTYAIVLTKKDDGKTWK